MSEFTITRNINSSYITFKSVKLPLIDDIISKRLNSDNLYEFKSKNTHIYPIRMSNNTSFTTFNELYSIEDISFRVNISLALNVFRLITFECVSAIILSENIDENELRRIYILFRRLTDMVDESLRKVARMLNSSSDSNIENLQVDRLVILRMAKNLRKMVIEMFEQI